MRGDRARFALQRERARKIAFDRKRATDRFDRRSD